MTRQLNRINIDETRINMDKTKMNTDIIRRLK